MIGSDEFGQMIFKQKLDANELIPGTNPYPLFVQALGPRPIEAPDLYPGDNQAVRHIQVSHDPQVGNYFEFTLYRDLDGDRGRHLDRQRNEIKVYNQSKAGLKGFEHSYFVYEWQFKMPTDMQFSKRFTHLFQLKAVGGNDKSPILTFTANERREQPGFEIRHNPEHGHQVLERVDWNTVAGHWLNARVQTRYGEQGWLKVEITRADTGQSIIELERENIRLWRGEHSSHFVRPKWGIYRSLVEKHRLNEQDSVGFANFSIRQYRY
ncbi:hypothetical protein [Vibrio sp. WXL210]|uniref:hypothetical protein n=1 Tax=Vibrio sp. WXL210 TaxID=3450709 RepID=UPI003EC8BB2C